MTREEYLDKVRYGLRRVEELEFYTKILDLAYEIVMTEECSEKHYDRVGLLVDCFRAKCLGLSDEIAGSLRWAEEYMLLPIPEKTE